MNPGLKDWWMQRISAAGISLFALPILLLWFSGYLASSSDWYSLLSMLGMKILTVIALLAYVAHVKIGLWVVLTDYVPNQKQTVAIWVVNSILLLHILVGFYLIWVF